jgi:hypothetical protein
MSIFKNGNAPGSRSRASPVFVPAKTTTGGGRGTFSNQSRRTSPRPVSISLQCKLAWDDYRMAKLPPEHPRRRPTVPKRRFLADEGGAS